MEISHFSEPESEKNSKFIFGPYCNIASDVILGQQVKLYGFCNLYGCFIQDETCIGTFVEIQKDVVIGKRCRIQSHTFICSSVSIKDDVFIGHNVSFINDLYPSAESARNKTWVSRSTIVENQVSIGSGCTILGGITLGEGCLIGAGSVVTKDVPPFAVVAGNPAKLIRYLKDQP